MSEFDLVVQNARVATASDIFCADIGIRDGRIVALAENLDGKGKNTLDAAGEIVTPGGVDAHVHIDQPMPDDVRMADDFHSGSVSAACGGTTTVIPFAFQPKGGSVLEAVEDYHRRADGKAVIDYAFHLIITDPSDQVLQNELPVLLERGYTSFKLYMTYEGLKLQDRQILDLLSFARRNGAMTMVHAENADCVEWLIEKLENAGHTAPKYHAMSRPSIIEREAAHRAITLSELIDTPILLVHVSGSETIEQIRWARGKGLKIYAETCPQYLFLTADDLDQDGFEGAKYICSPAPRDRQHQEAVWTGLTEGLFDIFSSDHSPFGFDDPKGKKLYGEDACFKCIPNGVPGVETLLPLLFSEGVGKGRISLNRFVELTSTNAAKLYGLYPRKGTIAVGSDADLVIWNSTKEVTIRNDMLHSGCDYTPYEGMKIKGWPAITISRGKLIWRDGTFTGQAGDGQFLPCDLPETAKPRGCPVVDIPPG